MASERPDEPITTPPPVGPDYIIERDEKYPISPALALGRALSDFFIRTPIKWVRQNIVEANRGPKYYWYHRKYERALPVDECYVDDYACLQEANMEYKRNFLVDRATLDLLRYRYDSCQVWNVTTKSYIMQYENCDELMQTYEREQTNFHIKYGDLTYVNSVLEAYTKQKHRLIMDRRRAEQIERTQVTPEHI